MALSIEHDIHWLPRPNRSAVVCSSAMPPLALVTSALALAFRGEHFLMTRLSQRGWDIPGGHIEPGESPEETVHREALEETGATLAHLELFAHQKITLLGKVPPGYRYPFPHSYQLFYLCDVAAVGCFKPTAEALESALFAPQEARQKAWVQDNPALYEAALQAIRGRSAYPSSSSA